jgi:hypothetical protein
MKAIAIVLAATVVACQATTSSESSQIHTVSAQVATFASYRTFGFLLAATPPPPYQPSARSFEVERRVREMVTAELAHRGYSEATASPDFLVRLSSGTAKVDKPEPTTTSGGNENDTHPVTLGEIVVDAFDRSTGQQVWHGTARAEIDPQKIDEPKLQAAVQQMFAPFPAHK